MERFAREDVLDVLRRFGIDSARRAEPLDPTEEVFLLSQPDMERVDATELTRALMDVLPHTKVWVVADTPRWRGEPL